MLRAILHEPAYAGNIGFVARLADNFAVDELVLVSPQCDIDGEARDRASHAQETLDRARIVDDLDMVLDDLDVAVGTTGIRTGTENVLRHGTTPREMADDLDPAARTGVVFGREGTGLSNDELDRCDYTVSIPASPDYPVMNLSHAAAVVLYELYQARDGAERDGELASREDRAVLENLFKGVADSLEWNGTRREKTVRAFRNVLGRATVTRREHRLLCGLFSDVQDRLGDDT